MSDQAVCDLCKKTFGDLGKPCEHWCGEDLATDETETTHEKQTDT